MATGVSRGEAAGTERFSLRLLGLGFWQGWWMLVLCTSLVLPKTTMLGIRPSTWALLLTSVGFVVTAAASHRAGEFMARRSMRIAAALLCSLGTLACIAFAASGLQSPILVLPAIGLAALGNALLLVMWCELWATLAAGRVSRYLFSSYAFAFVLYFAVQLLPEPAAALTVCVFPFASCAALRSAMSEQRRAPTSAMFSLDRSLVARAVVAVASAGFAYGIAQSFVANIATGAFPAGTGPFARHPDLLIAGACLIVIALFVMLVNPEVDPLAMYRPIVPALCAGLVLLAALPLGEAFVGNGFVILGGYCLDMIVMLVATDVAFRAKRSVALFFSCAILVLRLATIVGLSAVDLAVGARMIGSDDKLALFAGLAVAAIVVGTLVFTQSDLQKFYQPKPTLRAVGDMEERCASLAEACGLTAREGEVLLLLANGRNVPYLCKELCIAESTARHHVGSIYRKLGVYDRQSMLDVILQD